MPPLARSRARSKPLSPPSPTSTTATSGRSTLACRSASAVLDAVPATVTPCRPSRARALSRKAALSSTSKQRIVTTPACGKAAPGTLRVAGIVRMPLPSGPASPGPGREVIDDHPPCQPLELGEFGMQLADLAFSPNRGAEPVMGDRRHHQEARISRIQARIQPVSTLHASPLLPRAPGDWTAPAGSRGPAGRSADYDGGPAA